MRVDFLTNGINNKQSVDYKNTTQYFGNPNSLKSETNDTFSPSFSGGIGFLRGLAQKNGAKTPARTAVVAAVEKELSPAELVIKKVVKVLGSLLASGQADYSSIKECLKLFKTVVTDKNATFVDSLIKTLKPKKAPSLLPRFLDNVIMLAEKYNINNQSATLMQRVSEMKNGEESRFNIGTLTRIFGDDYDGSVSANTFVAKIVDAVALDGTPRFGCYAVTDNFKSFSSEKQPALDLLLDAKRHLQPSIEPSVLAQFVKETDADIMRTEGLAKIQPAPKEVFLLDIRASGLAEILKHYTPEKHSGLEKLVKTDFATAEIAKVLEHYTPEKHALFEKALNAVNKDGKRLLTGYDISQVLEHS